MNAGRVLVVLAVLALSAGAEEPAKLRVVVATGGHGFERQPFAAMFDRLPGIVWREVQHPKVQPWFKAEAARDYDVLVLYDMPAAISAEAKDDLLKLLAAGKGVVALHHCLGAYDTWPEYAKIIGGHYHLAPKTTDWVDYPASTYQEGVTYPIAVVDAKHPVTKDLKDFALHDEVYGRCQVNPDVTPLLTTTDPRCTATVGWTHRYANSQIVYLMPGHGPGAWNDANYQALLINAIRFVAAETHPK